MKFNIKDILAGLIILAAIVIFMLIYMLIPTYHCPYCGHDKGFNSTDKYCSECGCKLDTMYRYNAYKKQDNFLK